MQKADVKMEKMAVTLMMTVVIEEKAPNVLGNYFNFELSEVLSPSPSVLTALLEEAGINAQVLSVDVRDCTSSG